MITLSYIKALLDGKLNGITQTEKHIIESAGGYDGIVSLVQTKGISLIIVLENSEIGEFSILPGGFMKTSQSLWVMKMVGRDDDRHAVQNECFALMKRIISIFIGHVEDKELKQWEWERIRWAVRNAGANFTGYEFSLYFSEDIDLSYNGQE